MRKGREGRKEKRGGRRKGREGKEGRQGCPPLSEILNTPLLTVYIQYDYNKRALILLACLLSHQ